jgi:uncharacterized membrane protein
MKQQSHQLNKIDISFYVGLALKAVDAFIEVVGGLFMIAINHEWLNHFVKMMTIPELREDPNDIVMNYLLGLSQNLSISAQHTVALFMLFHGTTKLVVIVLLWKKKLWAYYPAVFIFGGFVLYEIYSYLHNDSVIVLLLIILDIAIIALILIEHKRLKLE